MPELAKQPIHLSRDGTAFVEPPLTGPEWFELYDERHTDDIQGGKLVTQYSFTESWTMWEIHPNGDEVVLCTRGKITLIQQNGDGQQVRLTICAGEYAINPGNVWHTADIKQGEMADCVFITPGEDTKHRPR